MVVEMREVVPGKFNDFGKIRTKGDIAIALVDGLKSIYYKGGSVTLNTKDDTMRTRAKFKTDASEDVLAITFKVLNKKFVVTIDEEDEVNIETETLKAKKLALF